MKLDLYTERLHLRPLTEDDLDLALEMFTDERVMRYGGGASTPAEIKAQMPLVTRRSDGGCIGVWCVIDRTTQEKIGSAALTPMPIEENDTNWDLLLNDCIPLAEIEIGYFYKTSVWGKGIATEAASRLLQFAFEDSPLDVVVACFEPENHASKNVLKKIGLRYESTRFAYGEIDAVYAITKQQWLDQQESG
ncbi:MAG: GNAT family N-acetyltransferase [Rhodospirillales bacterium]|nr:GNAT family N-acetyltransferase [Rhodospirillales bacterium]MBT4040515.1 GNAT family N-acetyltransferase [Rhodospirillales bacterium]MBT4626466.1 GNAT family N-acetyltransferase [Rhodospirillales bacterium]MBT5350851.1 GNAT family N-acetyltransferase [Rhodospirillales bacterium]MBT5520709.1 GNAT family N-acetyltransferase [Rhodospirillales bacterium]